MPSYTRHSLSRSRQRGVPPVVVEWLYDYGRVVRNKGADVYFLDKAARKTLRSDIGALAYKRVADLLDAYIVVSDAGQIITVARRYRRLKS